MPELAAEIVRLDPDIIIATGPEAVLRAVSSATSSIPILMVAADYDPVALGFVASLARPGGNVTGVSLQQIELTAKRVELLREAVPGVIDIAVFSDGFTPEVSGQMHAARGGSGNLQRVRLHLPVNVLHGPDCRGQQIHSAVAVGFERRRIRNTRRRWQRTHRQPGSLWRLGLRLKLRASGGESYAVNRHVRELRLSQHFA